MYRKQVPIAAILVSTSGYIRFRDLAVQLKLTVPSQMYTKRVPIAAICRFRDITGIQRQTHARTSIFGALYTIAPSGQ